MISKELFTKIENIINEHDYCALKRYYEHSHNSRIPGNEKNNYSMYGMNTPIGYLMSKLNDEEKEEMKNFDIEDLNRILYRDKGNYLHFGK